MSTEVVRLPAPAPEFFDEVISKSTSASISKITCELRLPAGPMVAMPLVIVSIGSMGLVSGREDLYANALNAAGIAVFIVNSFGGRGIQETVSDQGRVSWATSTSDAFLAMNHLAKDGRFDPRRVGILGYSRGADVSLLACDKRMARLAGEGGGFAAHVALYPPCFCQWETPQPTKAPVLMILGANDTLAPPARGLAYAERLRLAGADIETSVLSEAEHGFDTLTPASRTEAVHLADCEVRIMGDGAMIEQVTGIKAEGDWPTFLNCLVAKAGIMGAIVGHGPLPREIVVPNVVRFFQTHLARPDPRA